MLAWRVRLVRSGDGGRIGWKQALIRYIAALFSWVAAGAGFWWSLYDPEKRTWHDRLSRTELHMAPSFGETSRPR
jgi:uncharacterized RDD family membrane protein YckC